MYFVNVSFIDIFCYLIDYLWLNFLFKKMMSHLKPIIKYSLLFSVQVACAQSSSIGDMSLLDIAPSSLNGQTPQDVTKGSKFNSAANITRTKNESDEFSLMGTGVKKEITGTYIEKDQRTRFQDFVLSSTGKDYNLFGYDLFLGSRYGSTANLPVPMGYVIGPGDEIEIKLSGNIDSAIRLTVDRNGQITMPKIGSLMVSGVAYENLHKTIIDAVERVYKGVEVNATLGKMKSIQIFISGEAKKPGSHIVSGYATFLGAIFDTGGPSSLGTMRDIKLIRDGKEAASIDIYDFILNGKTKNDIHLKTGDVIQIRKALARVAVTGNFDKSAIYELKNSSESIGTLLSYGGGLGALSTPYKINLERIEPLNKNSTRSVIELDLTKNTEKTNLQDGDILTIFPADNEFKDAVTLRGNVAFPLRYPYKPNMRISDLIPDPKSLVMSEFYKNKNMLVQYDVEKNTRKDQEQLSVEIKNLLGEINWDYAAIQRFDYKKMKTSLIKFNLHKAIIEKDEFENKKLEPGDVVTVFGVKDMPIPSAKITSFVKISGEVNVPGVYQIDSGKTLNDLVAMAGGLTNEAYLYGSIFIRESTRIQQQDNLNKAISQMESEIVVQSNNILQNITDATGTTAQAQISGQKMFLQKLQGMKATGRVSLGLANNEKDLPAIALENEDSIIIPKKPSFVSAFGAVFAATSFIYKDGLSAGDLLNKAGVTRSSDVDSAFLVRANGSIEVNDAARSTWSFGSGFLNKKLNPGDTVFVPEMLDRRQAYSKFIQGAKDWTQLLYQFGLGAAAFKMLGN
jgi:protein involved in polysaccharide export with SLBB domain